MAVSSSPDEYGLRPVSFSRLTRRGLLLGLSLPQLACLAVAGVIIVAALVTGGGTGFTLTTPIWMPIVLIAVVRVNGTPLVGWTPILASWILRTLTGQTMFRKNLHTPRSVGTLALPGDATALRYYEDPVTGAVMVHDPHRHTLTAILEVTHPSFILLDPTDQQHRVDTWSRVLATCCRSGRIARLQILDRTLPDSGSGLTDWWHRYGRDDGSFTARIYQDLIRRAGPATERHHTTISLALDLKTAAKPIRAAGGGMRGAAHILSQDMATLVTALRSADLCPGGWLDAPQLAVMLRAAYDPQATPVLDHQPDVGRDLGTAGPVAVHETWTRLHTDTAWHAVMWISEWPRTQVYPGFLTPLLLSTGIRRAFTLICTPLRADQAAKDIRRKKTEHVADQAQRARIGQLQDAAQSAEYHDVLQQEADLATGHGICRYTGLVTITASTEDELQAGIAAIEQAAIQAHCETRLLAGQQAQAFTTAALPLCRAD